MPARCGQQRRAGHAPAGRCVRAAGGGHCERLRHRIGGVRVARAPGGHPAEGVDVRGSATGGAVRAGRAADAAAERLAGGGRAGGGARWGGAGACGWRG